MAGAFRVDRRRCRHLEEQARRLGFPGLRRCLQALVDAGHSVPRLAKELGTSQWLVSQTLGELGVRLPSRRARLAQQLVTVRRLLDRYGVRRSRRTAGEQAAAHGAAGAGRLVAGAAGGSWP